MKKLLILMMMCSVGYGQQIGYVDTWTGARGEWRPNSKVDSVQNLSGAGFSLYKVGSKNKLKRLKAGSGVTITDNTDSVTISADTLTGGTGLTTLYQNSLKQNKNTGFTAGSIPFIGTSGEFRQNNAKFFWDSTNARLGIGTTSPSEDITVVGTSVASISMKLATANNSSAAFLGYKARGSTGAETATLANDNLMGFLGRGHDGSAYSSANRAAILFKAAENFSATAQGTYMTFENTAPTTTTRSEQLRIVSGGGLFSGYLRVGGNTAPTNTTAGDLTAVRITATGWTAVYDSTPAQITANQNDYATGTAGVLRLSTDASRNITGFAGGSQGRFLYIVNVGAQNIVIQNQNASSTAANRVITGTGADVTLAADGTMTLWYDSTTSRWRTLN